jgi:SSS family solute:Na+ symporter
MSVHLILLLAYSALLIAISLWVGRLVGTSGAFFVAGRRLGAGLLFSTVLAANIGAGSTVGATGIGYSLGLGAWWWNGSAGIGSLLLALWIGPRIWRVATKHNLLTVGDFLEFRYGRTVRGVVAVLIWFGTLSILAGQLIGLAWILNVVAGIPKPAGCVLGGVLVTTYFTAGGLAGAAWVNVVQLTVKLVGFAIALPLVVQSVGGLPALLATHAASAGDTGFWAGSRSLAYLTLLVPAFMVSPGLLQKIYGARNERAVRVGIGVNAVALMVFAFVPALMGMAARQHYPALANQELALPTLMVNNLPAWVGALALAAVFSAEVSAADAVLFMLATSLSQDIYRRFLNPEATDRQVLGAARLAALAGGVLGMAIAIWSPTIIGALSLFYALLGVCLFVPIIAGFHARRAGAPEALASIAAGIVTDVAVRLMTDGRGIGVASPELIGLVAAAAAFVMVGVGKARARVTNDVGRD